MFGLTFYFITGRYHATPWNKQVNEGFVEWPPSPRRILRALIAAWYKQERPIDEQSFSSLLNKLTQPPRYLLPKATVSHTRHYMPLKKEQTSLIFDTFISILSSQPLVVIWDNVELSENETNALRKIIQSIPYLGRSESLVHVDLFTDPSFVAEYEKKYRKDDDYFEAVHSVSLPSDEFTLVPLLGSLNDEEYRRWKERMSNNRPSKRRKNSEFCESFFKALQLQTNKWKEEGWDKPPGSIVLTYTVRKEYISLYVEETKTSTSHRRDSPKVARFCVASAVPPLLKYSLSLAERVHQTLVKQMERTGAPVSSFSVFTGCDVNGTPRKDNHRHAFILFENMPHGSLSKNVITHMTIYAPEGFNEYAVMALHKLRRVWGHGGHDINFILLGVGQKEDFPESLLFRPSTVWSSLTPFVPTRHPKWTRSGKPKIDPKNNLLIGSPEHDLYRLLELQGFKPKRVSCTPVFKSDLSFINFTIERKTGGGTRSSNIGYMCEIEFNEPVQGPIAVGYCCHFGLGLFVPKEVHSQ